MNPRPDSSTTPPCATFEGEALPGTAKRARLVIAVEHAGGWGYEILDGEALGTELSARIAAYLRDIGAELHFIRLPGRDGQRLRHDPSEHTRHTVYIAWAEQGILETTTIDSIADLPDLTLTAPGSEPTATRVDAPLLLVCTHGRRDRCCAVLGRPVAAAHYPHTGGALIWEASHTKGHRFAPSMLLLPHNYSYGRLGIPETGQLLDAALAGMLYTPGLRGRGTFRPAEQVAEVAVAEELARAGTPLRLGEAVVTAVTADSAASEGDAAARRRFDVGTSAGTFRVELVERTGPTVPMSCGADPAPVTSWEVVSLEARDATSSD